MNRATRNSVIITITCLSLILFILFSTRAFATINRVQNPQIKSILDLQSVMKKMQEKTAVNIGVPGKLPTDIKIGKYVSYIRITTNRSFYDLKLLKDPECEDDTAHCVEAEFIGSSTPINSYQDETDPNIVKSTNIILKNGDKAVFYELVCGAIYCPPDTYLVWKHDQFNYMIDSGFDINEATDVANSMQ